MAFLPLNTLIYLGFISWSFKFLYINLEFLENIMFNKKHFNMHLTKFLHMQLQKKNITFISILNFALEEGKGT